MSAWISPKYSKKRVRKAGEALLSADLDSQEFRDAIPVLTNWRSAHAFPMQIMLDFLRKNSLKIDKKAVAVQRLKRIRSIFAKLVHEDGMSLDRMEDIAGCRVVVENIGHVRRIQRALKESRTQNVLHRERDYIDKPKSSGYRGVHLIYKYNCGKGEFKGMAVELQVRSKIQHSWATTVEVVGTYTRQALKASRGSADWLEFFRLVSAEFAKLESCPPPPEFEGVDTYRKMSELQNRLKVLDKLAAFGVATEMLAGSKIKGSGYFVLVFDLTRRVVNVARFDKHQLDLATEYCTSKEELRKEDSSIDVVLVSAGSVQDLRKAYPNYFADTETFIRWLRKVHEVHAARSSRGGASAEGAAQ